MFDKSGSFSSHPSFTKLKIHRLIKNQKLTTQKLNYNTSPIPLMPKYNSIANNSNSSKNNGNKKPFPITINTATVVAVPCPPIAQRVPVSSSKTISPTSKRELKDQGYTTGLIESISKNKNAFPIRLWVIDNSGSMSTPDGHRLALASNDVVRLLDCTRWAEIQDTVSYHARMASRLEAPTSFRLLNPACGQKEFSVAERPDHIQEDLSFVLDNIRQLSPMGVTPLAERIIEIASYVTSIRNSLEAKGQKAVVVLATDGLPTNRYGEHNRTTMMDFKNALRQLEGLPIWLVIRLCTDDDETVDFYNNIDSHLEMSCDVLDDFFAEAAEVYEHNKWLNYALPLHRMREMGFYHKLFDLIDERPLTKDELRDFFLLIYGANALDGIPDPQVEWGKFLERIAMVTERERLQFNPVRKRMMPWVDIRRLDYDYGNHPVSCKCIP